MRRCHYLTARCPSGCECWLHPGAVAGHVGRCRRHPWVDDVVESTIVTGPRAVLLAITLPPELLGGPSGHTRPLSPLNGEPAVALYSPIAGVAPRRWAQVALAAATESGQSAITDALDPARFTELEGTFGKPDELAVCPACGHTVSRRSLAGHQAKNTYCQWVRAVAQVRAAWEQGYRDPYSLGPGTPQTWGDLQRTVRWRNRIQVVPFPEWTAVLLSPVIPMNGHGSRSRDMRPPILRRAS